MLCELSLWGNFLSTWLFLSVLGLVLILINSGIVFYFLYYKNVSYETWTKKSNTTFPKPEKVKQEIITMTKGASTATFCPALTLYLAQGNLSQGYCGVGELGYEYLVLSFIVSWLASDFIEFYYHRIGHSYSFMWNIHKGHHKFYNPTPFAVIADEYIDQFFRSTPLLIFPLLFPINIDMMFIQYAIFFYGYGSYLHCGYEFDFLNAHNPIINTAFQHYLHHAISIKNKPYHTGFFFKIWDQIFGSVYKGTCFCAKCETKKGLRTMSHYEKSMKEKPDYSVLLDLNFWLKK